MEEDKKTHLFYFRRRKPGEQAAYLPTEKGGVPMRTYADIALVPNLGNNGSVLLISGIAMVRTGAGGELLTRKDASKRLSAFSGPIRFATVISNFS